MMIQEQHTFSRNHTVRFEFDLFQPSQHAVRYILVILSRGSDYRTTDTLTAILGPDSHSGFYFQHNIQ